MPFRLLVRAQDAPVENSPGAWRKGDIVVAVSDSHVFGNKETLPLFLRVRISNSNDAPPGWLASSTAGDGTLLNRRSVRVDTAEVDAIAAPYIAGTSPPPTPTQVHASFTLGQFTGKVVTRQ
jgi:hypothetical protein